MPWPAERQLLREIRSTEQPLDFSSPIEGGDLRESNHTHSSAVRPGQIGHDASSSTRRGLTAPSRAPRTTQVQSRRSHVAPRDPHQ